MKLFGESEGTGGFFIEFSTIRMTDKYYETVIGLKPKPGRKNKAQDWHIIQDY